MINVDSVHLPRDFPSTSAAQECKRKGKSSHAMPPQSPEVLFGKKQRIFAPNAPSLPHAMQACVPILSTPAEPKK